ncbi:MAG: methylmalonyl-CoA mutase family protein, partial [Actinomycetota bacterium]|nr:methylmalonyl-CoA mutase family protein [Actinomycetota bacterium]
FTTDEPRPDIQIYGLDEAGRQRQLQRLAEVKRTRNGTAVTRTLGQLSAAAGRDGVNLMPPLIEAVEAYCTVGEITQTLKDVWGEYRQPVVF